MFVASTLQRRHFPDVLHFFANNKSWDNLWFSYCHALTSLACTLQWNLNIWRNHFICSTSLWFDTLYHPLSFWLQYRFLSLTFRDTDSLLNGEQLYPALKMYPKLFELNWEREKCISRRGLRECISNLIYFSFTFDLLVTAHAFCGLRTWDNFWSKSSQLVVLEICSGLNMDTYYVLRPLKVLLDVRRYIK